MCGARIRCAREKANSYKTRKPRGRADPFESNIETALAPGHFVSYNANYDFVRSLEFINQQLQRLVPTEPIRAIALYETFIAGCYEKAEEIDDSSGSLGQFVGDLFRGWIIARQAAGDNPDETAIRILEWMDDDPYGFAFDLDKEAAKGADLHSLMDLLLQTKELDRLADLVRRTKDQALEGLSHYVAEPVAKKLEKTHPDLAARLWRAQGMRIVNAKKSKYYDAALSNFESAKRCFERAGLTTEWEKTVSQVRADHHRKIGFMSGFERLVAGSGPSDEPSFLERAKARWSGRQRKER